MKPVESTVQITRRGNWVTVGWRGDVDRVNIANVQRSSLDVVLNSDHGLVIDLSATTYLDSSAMGALMTMHRALAERQQRVRVILPTGSVLERALDVAGIPSVVPVCRSLDEAMAD